MAEEKHHFRPLYPMDSLAHYYSVLYSCVLNHFIFDFIPFSSHETLSYHEIQPFPTFVNHSMSVEMKLEHNLVLLTSDCRFLAFPSSQSLSDDCVSITLHEWLCPAANIHFFHSNNYLCLLDVLIHHNTSRRCILQEVHYSSPKVIHMNVFNYLYLPNELALTVDCGITVPSYRRLLGNLVVSDHCGIEIPNVLRVFPSHVRRLSRKLYMGDGFDIVLPKFSISHLQNSVQPITESPYLLKKDDDSDVWWDLDSYEETHSLIVMPTALITTIIVMVVIFCVCYVRKTKRVVHKVKTVTKKLESQVPPSPPNPQQDTEIVSED